jgi:hypothetical protein
MSICCNGLYNMLPVFVPNISSIFRRMLQVCLSGCCICFTRILQVFYLDVSYVCNIFQVFFHVFLQVFQTHVSSVLSVFLHVASIASRCFKSRSDVASPSPPSAALLWCLLLAFCCLASFSDCEGVRRGMATQTRARALSFRQAGKYRFGSLFLLCTDAEMRCSR